MRKASLGVIFFTVFLDLIGFGIVIPLLPRYAESFHASGLQIGLLAASYSLMQFLFNPIWGRLSDRVGRRPVLLCSLAGFVISYGMLGWAPSLPWLFAARILAGISGANIATAQAYIADITTPDKRAQGMGLIGVAFGLGFTLGPALSGFLAGSDPLHPRYDLIGFAAGGMSLAALILAFFFLPESLPKEGVRTARPRLSWNNLKTSLLRPGLAPLFFMFFVASFAFANMESTFSLFLEHRFHLGARAAGYFFVLIGLVIALMQGGMVRILVPKYGEVPVLRAGLFVMTLGMFALALAGSVPATALAIAAVAMGNGMLARRRFPPCLAPRRWTNRGACSASPRGWGRSAGCSAPSSAICFFSGVPRARGCSAISPSDRAPRSTSARRITPRGDSWRWRFWWGWWG